MASLEGVCSVCKKAAQEIAGEQNYLDKLMQALHHPEPQTAKRAAWILGELGNAGAVSPLLRALQSSQDIYFMEAVIEALGKIGEPSAASVIEYYCTHGAIPVRRAARRAVEAHKHEWPHGSR
jgi:HEAT repeat protein